eukprot:TRINITY_DN44384_c0_g1_i1.p1 TRINITY_DN44384_c0_g1~~TRINITY_DN44384_c0_g1_i1.p1  ORF type:complete len:286 (-),score=48.69 TRINITY_DN44384_c0_g1_i1:183-1040(-)
MGTLVKRLGQLQGIFQRQQGMILVESESRNILRTAAANKVLGSLALALDGTLKEGHDMKTFGLGTAASLANRERYARFTASMFKVYSAMEEELDKSNALAAPAVHYVWARHGATLRRAQALEQDLGDVSEELTNGGKQSLATDKYVEGIRRAGEDDRLTGGGRLLGHFYCRYFADLFGGQMLAMPTRAALSLPADTPRHYAFAFPTLEEGAANGGRRAYIEDVYRSLNCAGDMLSADARAAIADEALMAFKYNIDVYSEEPMFVDALRGGVNMCTGIAMSKLRSS